MEPLALDHLVIAVSDPGRSSTFYEHVLGAEVRELPRGRLAYRLAGVQLNVHMGESTPHPRARIPVAPGNSDLCFVWPGPIESAVAHLEAHDVAVIEGPTERQGSRGPGLSVYFNDPDGSLLEFLSYDLP